MAISGVETRAEKETVQAGVKDMPPWEVGELADAPRFGLRQWAAMIGPGLMMAGASIGSGEWLLGPAVSARYGGALLWLATLSIFAQLIYNLEASRYALYTGEPIMTGKFRTRPGPKGWTLLYLLIDFGTILPYQIANIATLVAAISMARLPDPVGSPSDAGLLQTLTYVMLFVAMAPLLFGGKVYNSLKAIMTVKIVFVFSFLAFLAIFYSSAGTWGEILAGFISFGNVPVEGGAGAVDNVFGSLFGGRGWPQIDESALPLLAAFAAIAGVGGMAQTTISNYTRDQGWGMGREVGAIPSVIGGRDIELSHTGKVFRLTPETIARWRRWCRHVARDQVVIWMPASVIGMALPSMLSIEFLPRGTVGEQWTLAGMTAGGVAARLGGAFGDLAWYLILISGVLVLLPNAASQADGFIRRWVDVAWTATPRLREWDPRTVRYLYFGILLAYFSLGIVFLSIARPMWLIIAYGNLGNFALGFSCWHVLVVNQKLLPEELRPGLLKRIMLFLAGAFFFALAGLTLFVTLRM